MTVGELLWKRVTARDFDSLAVDLADLSADERAEARAWYGAQWKGVRRYYAAGTDWASGQQSSAWTESLLAVHLAGPMAAAQRVRWNDLWWHEEEEYLDRFCAALVGRGRDWCATFVPAASRVRVERRHLFHRVSTLHTILSRVVERHDLEVPSGEAYVHGWLLFLPPMPDLVDALAQQRGLDILLPAALAHPWFGHRADLAQVLPDLVERGALCRATVIELVLTALTTPGKPSTQRALARALEAVSVGPADLTGRLPLVQGFVATCHGSVGAVLLTTALALCETVDDVVELCTTITGRPERRQKADLLKELAGPETTARLGVPAVLAGLDVLAQGVDAALADRVAAARARLAPCDAAPGAVPGAVTGAVTGAVPAPASLGLWEREVQRPQPEPGNKFGELTTFGDNAVALVNQEVARIEGQHRLNDWREGAWLPPVVLSLLFRWVHAEGVDAVKAQLGAVQAASYAPTVLGETVGPWLRGELTVDAFRSAVRESRRTFEQTRQDLWWTYDSTASFALRHGQEALLRAGRSPVLLSTPSYPDGTFDFDDLVGRLRACEGTSFGPLDLLQALLRLRPTAPDRADELRGLAPLPPDNLLPDEPCGIPDAVEFLREWVGAGGLRPPDFAAGAHPPSPQWGSNEYWRVELPVPLGAFPTCPPEPLGHQQSYDGSNFRLVHVAPQWPDLLFLSGRPHQASSTWSGSGRRISPAGRVGVVIHDALLREYAAADRRVRVAELERTLDLVAQGRFEVEPCIAAARGRLAVSRANLRRYAEAWEQCFLEGAMRQVWPAAWGVADLASTVKPLPQGLPDLLRMLARYVPEVPGEVTVPPGIRALANGRSASKARAEARALVAAVEGRA